MNREFIQTQKRFNNLTLLFFHVLVNDETSMMMKIVVQVQREFKHHQHIKSVK
jgi:hypothetical protein